MYNMHLIGCIVPGVSMEWCLVKPDWWGWRSELEESLLLSRARTLLSVNFG